MITEKCIFFTADKRIGSKEKYFKSVVIKKIAIGWHPGFLQKMHLSLENKGGKGKGNGVECIWGQV